MDAKDKLIAAAIIFASGESAQTSVDAVLDMETMLEERKQARLQELKKKINEFDQQIRRKP